MEKKLYFLGMDISKLTIDYKLIDLNDKVLLTGQITNDEKGIKQFLKLLKEKGFDLKQTLFGMENTGIYCNPFKVFSVSKSLDIVVANAYDIAHSKGIRREKSDGADAFMIAQYLRKNLPTIRLYIPDSEVVTQLKRLQSSRQILLKQRHQLDRHLLETKGFISSKEYKKLADTLNQTMLSIQKTIVALDQQINDLLCQDDQIENNVEIIESIPGVGRQTAIALVTATNNFQTIDDPRKAACHAGVAPFKRESGTSIKNVPKVSHLANKSLKKALHMAALSAVKWCVPIKLFYEKKVAEGKNKMSVLNAVRNKIIHMVFAMIRKNEKYNYSNA
jgi:transposase